MGRITVSALYLHPVKSCRGFAVDHVSLDTRGFSGDRRFLVVDPAGRFLTQRDTPRLALVAPTHHGGLLQLAAPDACPFNVPTTPASAPGSAATTRDVVIWHDTVRAVDLGEGAATWLTAVLQRPARLVGIGDDYTRPVRGESARPGDEVSFADAHPLLVISEASLADLNGRLEDPLPMNRFRPNLVVRGAPAFAEDEWKRIRIGDVVLRASGPCARCVMTSTDQETLARGKEPLRTLAQYRRSPRGDVNFGQNYGNESKSGPIRVGDEVEILE